MPAGYPTLDALRAGGWLPVPREPLPFPQHRRGQPQRPAGALSSASPSWRATGAAALVDLGEVGHLNPASGYGDWPRGRELDRPNSTRRR